MIGLQTEPDDDDEYGWNMPEVPEGHCRRYTWCRMTAADHHDDQVDGLEERHRGPRHMIEARVVGEGDGDIEVKNLEDCLTTVSLTATGYRHGKSQMAAVREDVVPFVGSSLVVMLTFEQVVQRINQLAAAARDADPSGWAHLGGLIRL